MGKSFPSLLLTTVLLPTAATFLFAPEAGKLVRSRHRHFGAAEGKDGLDWMGWMVSDMWRKVGCGCFRETRGQEMAKSCRMLNCAWMDGCRHSYPCP
jgi:hypothetical protein